MTVAQLREILNDMDGDTPILYFAPVEGEWRSGNALRFELDKDESNENKITLFISD